jgi:hypothetical protein
MGIRLSGRRQDPYGNASAIARGRETETLMDEQQEQEQLGRRRLLRGAGAVVAGVAGVSVAGAVAATPAAADTGDPVIAGQGNDANATTVLTRLPSAADGAALLLENENGPALGAQPVGINTPYTGQAPPGSLFIDVWGDIVTIGQPDPAQPKFPVPLYSPTWATMTIPITPFRILDTRDPNNRSRLTGLTPDGAGRVQGDSGRVHLGDLIEFAYAVQCTVTIANASRNGFIAVWGAGPHPGHSSVNFTPLFPISNFVQSEIGGTATVPQISVLVTVPAAVMIDVVGFIMADPFTDFAEAAPAGIQATTERMKVARAARANKNRLDAR